MKRKKTLARICAMVAVALVVASLAIPAFASYDEAVEWPPSASYKQAFRNHYLPDEMNNSTFNTLEMQYTTDKLFTSEALISGTFTSLWFNEVKEYGSVNNASFQSVASFSIYHPDFSSTVIGGRVRAEFSNEYFVLKFYDENVELLLTVQYAFVFFDGQCLSSFVSLYDDTTGMLLDFNETTYLTIAFSTNTMLAQLINDACIGNIVLYPEAYYRGYLSQAEDEYQKGYDQGKIDAINTIDSGEFGKQFIGSVFRAPFDFMREFTLVEWTTEGGTDITISLATIISAGIGVALFIWFLKLFAGG